MDNKILTLISGSSGVGKNTVMARLIQDIEDSCVLRSCTSRQIRVDDKLQKDGKYAYEFLTKKEFEEKIDKDEMLEYDVFSDNYYGISSGSIEQALNDSSIVIKDITVKGAINCKTKLTKTNIVTIFLTLEKNKLKKRLKIRQTKDIAKRMKHYRAEQKSIPNYDYCIYNDDLDATLIIIKAIINTAKSRQLLVLGENESHINLDKVNKIVHRLKSGGKVRPIEVRERDGKIYVVKGANTYLASIYSKTSVVKYFTNRKIEDVPQDYWQQLLK